MSSSTPPAAHVAKQVLASLGDRLQDQALLLTTPVPSLVPISKVRISAPLRVLVEHLEPQVSRAGLYGHQADIINMLGSKKFPNVVMTTSTGSGKSLGFWAWAFQLLLARPASTVAATFPTQALLWGQAKKLAKASDPKSLVEFSDLKGAVFAGTIETRGVSIPWTVWYGTQRCDHMKKHQESEAFSRARLRLCTLDKVHYNLMSSAQRPFLEQLDGMIVDEAHVWHGLMGANVRSLFDRIHVSMDMLGRARPAYFLASATLADSTGFAEALTGVPASSFKDVSDRGAAKARLIPVKDVPRLLARPAEPGLLRRYVMLLRPDPEPLVAVAVLGNAKLLGEANALCFVQSKFSGKRLRIDIMNSLRDRDVIVYDGDLSAKQRREIEGSVFARDSEPKVIVGTSALELGVDLPTLDVVLMDELPARRSELLQRLGRVGRSADRPGLAILCLGFSPADERLIHEPLAAVAADSIKPIPVPLHLDIVRLRGLNAAFDEWHPRISAAQRPALRTTLERYFGWAPVNREALKAETEKHLRDVIEDRRGSWYYKGFRASASEGKRDLVLAGRPSEVVATIEDIAIFRDAHPEGIYLGHRGERFRVTRYVGNWDVATWESPTGTVLGKYMKGLTRIEVMPERLQVATRGRWKDTFTLEFPRELARDAARPATGKFTFGVFTFVRKFDGYVEIDLQNRAKPKVITLADVAARFRTMLESGKEAPFLHNFSYRTTGWKWLVSRVLDDGQRARFAPVIGPLLESFFADELECSPSDLDVMLDHEAGEVRVIDTTPGGSGLSEALLRDGRIRNGFESSLATLRSHAGRGTFRRYLAEECRVESTLRPEEVLDAVERLARAWNG